MDHDTFIDKLGGPSVIAKALGVKPNAVSNWKNREIPWRERHKLAEMASQGGVPLPEGFLPELGAA